MFPTFCPPTIWTISLEFYRKPSILAADDFLGACYRKAMTPKKLWTLLFLQTWLRSVENSTDRFFQEVWNFERNLTKRDPEDFATQKVGQTTTTFVCLPGCRKQWWSQRRQSRAMAPWSRPREFTLLNCWGSTRRGAYAWKGMFLPSKCLLEGPFLEPLPRTLLRTLLRALFPSKTHHKTPSNKLFLKNLLEAVSRIANPFPPLQPSKTPETPNLSKICPSDCFGGFQSGGLKFGKICQNLKNGNFRTIFDKFFQISVPLTGTPQNNRWDKFWTNLGFRAFFEGCKGEEGSQLENPSKNPS